jgi:hypothetical protein
VAAIVARLDRKRGANAADSKVLSGAVRDSLAAAAADAGAEAEGADYEMSAEDAAFFASQVAWGAPAKLAAPAAGKPEKAEKVASKPEKAGKLAEAAAAAPVAGKGKGQLKRARA